MPLAFLGELIEPLRLRKPGGDRVQMALYRPQRQASKFAAACGLLYSQAAQDSTCAATMWAGVHDKQSLDLVPERRSFALAPRPLYGEALERGAADLLCGLHASDARCRRCFRQPRRPWQQRQCSRVDAQ